MPHTIGLIGGTGPEGRGLAIRFARAGHHVVIGSRDAERGATIAQELAEMLGLHTIRGGANAEAAAESDIAIITVPYDAHHSTLEGLREELVGKIVVDTVVPVVFSRGPRPVDAPHGSATEDAAAILPESRIIGAFHNLSAETLADPTASVDSDVLVTGSDREAKRLVMQLAEEIEGARAVDAGPLRFSRIVEHITVLLIGINGRYKTHSGIRITHVDTMALRAD